MKDKPRYMLIYGCAACGKESGYTEHDKPKCRYCKTDAEMKLVSRQEITPEIMAERLKKLTDSMFANLQSAFEGMTDEDKAKFPTDEDPEKQMLLLLAKAKSLKEKVQSLKLKEPKNLPVRPAGKKKKK